MSIIKLTFFVFLFYLTGATYLVVVTVIPTETLGIHIRHASTSVPTFHADYVRKGETKKFDFVLNGNERLNFKLTIHVDDQVVEHKEELGAISEGFQYSENYPLYEIDVEVRCNENFYGESCNVFCNKFAVAKKNKMCDANGNVVCTSGWTGKNCESIELISPRTTKPIDHTDDILCTILLFVSTSGLFSWTVLFMIKRIKKMQALSSDKETQTDV